jgi:hypothetical protein
MLEYNCPFDESTRNTTLFENLHNAALDAETQQRPIVKSSHLVNEARSNNIAIKSRVEIQRLILIRKMEPTKLEEFDTFPLTSQLGIIHAIPEEDFDIARATISDLCFLGLFPKSLFQALCKYKLIIKKIDEYKSGKFRTHIDALTTAIIYHPITMQKVIQIMLTHHRTHWTPLRKMRITYIQKPIQGLSLLLVLASRRLEQLLTIFQITVASRNVMPPNVDF